MSTYKLLLKSINAENKAYDNGIISDEDYAEWKESILKKMDTFLICGRITDEQYRELSALIK